MRGCIAARHDAPRLACHGELKTGSSLDPVFFLKQKRESEMKADRKCEALRRASQLLAFEIAAHYAMDDVTMPPAIKAAHSKVRQALRSFTNHETSTEGKAK
jgi:hypothetical protein